MQIPCKDDCKDIMELMAKGVLYELDLDMNDVNYNLMYDAIWDNSDIQDKFELLSEDKVIISENDYTESTIKYCE